MGRTPCCSEAGLRKGAWTADEDQKLISFIQVHGVGGWRTLPQKAGIQRCGKSCRLRWANYLRPDIKRGEFSTEEEQKIIQLHASLGNRWSAIARHLPKRTDNEIKNYWNTHLKKRLVDKDPVTLRPSPTSSSIDAPCNVGDERSDSEIRPIQRYISTSAKLINRVSAKFAQMQRKEMENAVSTPSPCLDAIKAVLLNSDRDIITFTGGGGCEGGDGNDSDVEIIACRPTSRSSSSRILNKMASKLKPLKNLDLIKNRLSVPSKHSIASASASDGGSYNNIDSPISISDFLESIPTSSSACESSEFTGNLSMDEDQVNEAIAAFHQAMELETTATTESPIYTTYELEEFLGSYGGGEEDGATFTNDEYKSKACDAQVATSREPATDFMEQFTNMDFGFRHNEQSTMKDYFCGEEENHGGALQENLNYWNQDFDW